MTAINLNLIQPSPNPVRTTWDEDKLNELAQSIKEQGLIVPVKVRPVSDEIGLCEFHGLDWLEYGSSSHYNQNTGYDEGCGECFHLVEHFPFYGDDEDEDGRKIITRPIFEIVYGHRRVEAARHAGLEEIEAIVETADDTNTLIQALIENVQREDMTPIDTAKALLSLKEKTGWNDMDLERRGVMQNNAASRYISLLNETPKIQGLIARGETRAGAPEGKVTPLHIQQVVPLKDEPSVREAVIEKAAKEGLSAQQTRKVAESVAATQDPRRRDALLNTPYSSLIHDPEINRERAERYGEYDPLSIPKEPAAGAAWDMAMEVKIVLDYLKSSRQMVEEVEKMEQMGKFAPEAVPFVARKIKTMIEAWSKLLDEWRDKYETL